MERHRIYIRPSICIYKAYKITSWKTWTSDGPFVGGMMMIEYIIYALFIGLPILFAVAVIVATLRRRSQTFEDI